MNLFNFKESVGKTVIFSFGMALFFSFGAVAQVPMQQGQQQVKDDFSKNDLEKFVDVYLKANEVQQGNEAVMIQSIEEEDLDVNRFNEILTAQQNQQKSTEIEASAEEMAAFNKAAEKIMKIQQEAQVEIEQLIEEEIGSEKYQQIVMAYQQRPDLQQKVNQLLEEKQGK